jgi:hypothetical protein
VKSVESWLTFRRKMLPASSKPKHKPRKERLCFLPAWCWLLLLFCRWRGYVFSEGQLIINRLHGVISQKTVVFIITGVRTTNRNGFLVFFCQVNIPNASASFCLHVRSFFSLCSKCVSDKRHVHYKRVHQELIFHTSEGNSGGAIVHIVQTNPQGYRYLLK